MERIEEVLKKFLERYYKNGWGVKDEKIRTINEPKKSAVKKTNYQEEMRNETK